ncbi:MAG TPA: hypothetical protein DC001_02365, partial [Clostridiales bacterium]|nr:hypothetical protein [Clostridiales bacterium]
MKSKKYLSNNDKYFLLFGITSFASPATVFDRFPVAPMGKIKDKREGALMKIIEKYSSGRLVLRMSGELDH